MAVAAESKTEETKVTTMTAVLTGCTGKIGGAIARGLAARKGSKVILVCRNEAKGKKLLKSMDFGIGSSAELCIADFNSVKSTMDAVAKIKSENASLDVLINSAAIVNRSFKETADGFEQMFQVNVLSYFLLSFGLLETLKKGSGVHGLTRIVHVSSNYSRSPLPANLDDFAKGSARLKTRFDGNDVYQQTKKANRMVSAHLAAMLRADSLTDIGSYSCHPGVTSSAVLSGLGFGRGSDTPEQCAITSLYLALSKDITAKHSGFYFNRSRGDVVVGEPCAGSKDTDANKALWEYCQGVHESYI